MSSEIRIIFGKGDPVGGFMERVNALREKGVQIDAIDGSALDSGKIPSPVLQILKSDGRAKEIAFGKEAVNKVLEELDK